MSECVCGESVVSVDVGFKMIYLLVKWFNGLQGLGQERGIVDD